MPDPALSLEDLRQLGDDWVHTWGDVGVLDVRDAAIHYAQEAERQRATVVAMGDASVHGVTPDGEADCGACVGIGHTPCDLTPLAYAPATKEGGDDLPPCVTVDEIDQQRTLGWPDFHPEDYCHRCGGRNVPSWTVDSDRFNTAFGPPWEHPYNGIVCPGCFVDAHERATGMRATWALVPLETTPFRWLDGEPERRGCPAPTTEEGDDG